MLRYYLFPFIFILLAGSACNAIPTVVVDQQPQIDVLIAQTAAVQLTESAGLQPQNTATVTPTLLPLSTMTPTNEPTITPTVELRDIALLMGVLSVGDGTQIFPGERFDVVWRLRNVGETDWDGNYRLVLTSGDAMGAPDEIPLSTSVEIGEIIELRLKLTAPEVEGDYFALWLLQNGEGELFGVDDAGIEPLQVRISVIDSPVHSSYRQVLKFYEGFSTADWYDQSGSALCEAPGNVGEHGLVYRDNAAEIQDGVVENEPSLIMIPAEGTDGMISGKFPPFVVKAGDYFVTYIGCLEKGSLCDVTFRLDYQVVGEDDIQTVGEWQQSHTGRWSEIRKNLTKLDGLEVQFILVVENNGNSLDDYAIWFVPAIYR